MFYLSNLAHKFILLKLYVTREKVFDRIWMLKKIPIDETEMIV